MKPLSVAILTSDKRDHDRDYTDPVPGFGTAPKALLEGFAKLPDVEIHVVSCTQQVMTAPAKLAQNIFFHSLHVPKIGWMRTGYLGCIRAVRRKLREIQPDIVHGQGTERDCALAAVLSGFPNVLTIHGNMRAMAELFHSRPFSFNWLAARLEAFTLPRSDGIVSISTYTLKAVEALAKKTWLLPNAVDGSFFEIENRPTNPPRILCIGNVDARKNQNALIRALDDFPGTKNFELVFFGVTRKTPYADEFLGMVAARPWCRYEGFLSHEDLRKNLATAAGLTLPTLEDNCPMVVLEAMAAGVPVAAARVGGVPDLVRHEETGLLFDPLNEKEMARATVDLLMEPARTRAARAREEARARFYPETIARRHVDIYCEVLSEAERQA